jgi:hypothetical protein
MSSPPKPQAGRSWSRPPRAIPRGPFATEVPSARESAAEVEEAQLARDLSALTEAGLIRRVAEGVTTRYAVAGTEGEEPA